MTAQECRDVALLARIWWEVHEAKGDLEALDACAAIVSSNKEKAQELEDDGWLRWLDRRGRWRK